MYTVKPLILSIATCLLLTACGESDNSSVNNNNIVEKPNIPVIKSGLVLAQTNEAFAGYYKKSLQSLNSGSSIDKGLIAVDLPQQAVDVSPTETPSSSNNVNKLESDSSDILSSTNLVERGIDELDFVKQNSSHIFTTDFADSHYIKVFAKPSVEPIATLKMPNLVAFKGLYLKDAQLFSLQQKNYKSYGNPKYVTYLDKATSNSDTDNNSSTDNSSAKLELDMIDVSNPTQPNFTKKYIWDGVYQDSRRIGDTIFVVSKNSINTPYVCTDTDNNQSANLRSIKPWQQCELITLTPEEIAERMPVDISGNKIQPSDCYIPSEDTDAQFNTNITLITQIDLTNNEQHATTCVASSVNHVYMSNNAIYLTDSSYNYPDTKTNINQFSFNTSVDSGLMYNGKATIDGHIDYRTRNFSMNEHNDVLRVFTTQHIWDNVNLQSSIKNMFHTLTTKTEGVSLEKLATIPNEADPKAIGKPNEEIKSIRYMGDEAYVVTFERTDPLYKLDLAVGDQPKIVGELEMPGYSTYLQRINDTYLMGIGFTVDERARSTGIQTTIFDTSMNNPVIVDQHTRPFVDESVKRSLINLPLQHDSRAIMTVADSTHLRISLPYKLSYSKGSYSNDSTIQRYENNALEYNINQTTGNIDNIYDRNITTPTVIDTAQLIAEGISNDEIYEKRNKSIESHYDTNVRVLMDNNDIYYTQPNGSIIKYNW